MFLLFGFNTTQRALPQRPATCQFCHSFVPHHLVERATRFTLFFIPIFTTSRKYQITCTNCGQVSTINSGQKNSLLR